MFVSFSWDGLILNFLAIRYLVDGQKFSALCLYMDDAGIRRLHKLWEGAKSMMNNFPALQKVEVLIVTVVAVVLSISQTI